MNRIKQVIQHELNNSLFDLNNVSKKTLKKCPDMIRPLAEAIHEEIEALTLISSKTQLPPLILKCDKDVSELVQLILSNSKGLKDLRDRDPFLPSETDVLLTSVIRYATISEEEFSSETALAASSLLLKGLSINNNDDNNEKSELDILLQSSLPTSEQSYACKNYHIFKVMCGGDFQKESFYIVDALIKIYNFSRLYITSKEVPYVAKIEDAFQNNDFNIAIKNNEINTVEALDHPYFKKYSVEIKVFFTDTNLASGLKGNCFSFELYSPETVELINSILIKNSPQKHFIFNLKKNQFKRRHDFGIYSKNRNNKEVESLFKRINDSLLKLLSSSFLDKSFAYTFLMNVLQQHELKEILVSVGNNH
jgi:hypothetical protein